MTSKPLPYKHTAVTGGSHVKWGIAEMLKGGVIMDVVNVDEIPQPHRLVERGW